MSSKRLHIFGAGYHSSVVLATAINNGYDEIIFVEKEQSAERPNTNFPLINEDELDVNEVNAAFIGIGNNQLREKIYRKFSHFNWINLIHSSAIIEKNVTLGIGNLITAGAILQSQVTIKNHCIINTGASVDHHGHIESYCHIAPQVTITGNVKLNEGVMIGANSTLIPKITIGAWSIVGAGSVVSKSVPPYSKAVGVPARISKINRN